MFLLFIYLLFAMIPCFALLSFVGQRPLATHALNLSPTWSALFFVSHFYFPSKWLPFEVSFLVQRQHQESKVIELMLFGCSCSLPLYYQSFTKANSQNATKKNNKKYTFWSFFCVKETSGEEKFWIDHIIYTFWAFFEKQTFHFGCGTNF